MAVVVLELVGVAGTEEAIVDLQLAHTFQGFLLLAMLDLVQEVNI